MSLSINGVEVSEDNALCADLSLCSNPTPDTWNTEFLIHEIEFYMHTIGKKNNIVRVAKIQHLKIKT